MNKFLIASVAVLLCPSVYSQSNAEVEYLGNEAVRFTHGATTVLFDPLFSNDYDIYQRVPDDMRQAMFDGDAPFEDVEAVFVSHYHGDHFDPSDMLRLLKSQPGTHLYAPLQAVTALREAATPVDADVFDRVSGLDLDYGDAPVTIETETLLIDAVHIPHSGWPSARTDVQNIAYRVTLNDSSSDDAPTAMHLGDADARKVHFAASGNHWDERDVDIAFPPFWFFMSEDGRQVLSDEVVSGESIGVHVPAEYANSDNIPEELQGFDLFTRPGEIRRVRN